jgi:hypothetical protein
MISIATAQALSDGGLPGLIEKAKKAGGEAGLWRRCLRGNPELAATNPSAADADAYAETLREVVTPPAGAGETTRAIAKALNDRGIKTVRGGDWQSPQIMRLLARLKLR